VLFPRYTRRTAQGKLADSSGGMESDETRPDGHCIYGHLLGLLDYLFTLELGGLLAGNAVAIGTLVVAMVAAVVVAVILSRQAA